MEGPTMAVYDRGRDMLAPKGSWDAGPSGAHRSIQQLLSLIDTSDPAWPLAAGILREFAEAGVELDAPVVAAAVKLGKHRHAGSSAEINTERQRVLAVAAGAIVYYGRRADLIKIGTTTSPRSRFGDLLPDEILAFEPGSHEEETLRHRQFKPLRVTGEYFRDAPELREHIRQIRSLYGDPDPSWPTMGRGCAEWRAAPAVSTETMTTAQAESELGINPNTLYAWVHRGRLKPAGNDGWRRQVFYREHLIELRDTPQRRMITSF
jgi:Helix-turn-helix domain